MKKIKIKNKEYKIKYTVRALFIWEQITGKSFQIKNLLDNYLFFYSMILANNSGDDVLTWDDFIDALDANPELFSAMAKAIEEDQKNDKMFTHDAEEDGKKGAKKKK